MNRIASWIMKCIKKKKQMSEVAVIKYVLNNLPSTKREDIQKTIEELLDKEYIIRKEGNHEILLYNTYHVC